MEDFAKRLKKEGEITLSNTEFQQEIGGDDIREAVIELKKTGPTWSHGFSIDFNGKVIHSCKTAKSFNNRLKTLIDHWTLKEII